MVSGSAVNRTDRYMSGDIWFEADFLDFNVWDIYLLLYVGFISFGICGIYKSCHVFVR